MPTDSKETLFARFLASIASLFKPAKAEAAPNPQDNNVAFQASHNVNNPTSNPLKPSATMLQSLSLVGEVLNIEGFAVGENGVTLTAEQALAVERALAERDKRNAELAEQVQALKAAPAEKSPSVVDASQQQTPKSPIDEFASKVNSAKKLFNLVP